MLAIALGRHSPATDHEDGGGSDDGDERDAADSFFDAIDLPQDKREDAYAALTSVIEACVAKAMHGGYGDEEK